MARYDEIANTVETRFSQAYDFKDEAWGLLQAYMDEIADSAPEWDEFLTDVNLGWSARSPDIDTIPTPSRPSTDLIVPDMPSPQPSIPDVDVEAPVIPDLDVIPPIYEYPDKPTAEFPDDFDEEYPTDDLITFPSRPDDTMPDAPSFSEDISVEGPPDVILPYFDAEAPEYEIESPGNTFAYAETPYSSELLTATEAWLLDIVQNGGTGLADDVEAALIARARARRVLEHDSKYQEAQNFFSGGGHTLPPGGLSGRILNIQEQIGKEVQQQDDDILIEQARLAQSNTHFGVEQALAAETMLLDDFHKTAQRAFEVARTRVALDIDIFNAEVAAHNAELETYKTKAAVYETRIRAANLILEQYKLTLEGKELQVKIRESVLRQYNLQLEGVKTLFSLYQTEAQVAKIKADINISRIEGYKARIDAYTARIGGVTAQYNAYVAELSGEKTKAEVYMTQVEAYMQRIKAISIGKTIEIDNAKLQLQEGQMDIEIYKSKLEAFKAELQGNVSEIEAESTAYKAAISGYEAQIKALIMEAEAETESYKNKYVHESNLIDQRVKKTELKLEKNKAEYAFLLDKFKKLSEVTAQTVASALSGVSAQADYGYNEGVSTNYSYDQTKSVPTTSFNYNY